jgi:CRISPR-associated protein Csx3
MLYNIKLEKNNILRVSFGDPAKNDAIVKEVNNTMKTSIVPKLTHGAPVCINGPASLPIAACIVHHVAHLVPAVACYDPKLGKYVVSIEHGGTYQIGQLL